MKIGLLWSNKGPSWSWSYGSWIYNYLWNQCLSPLKLWVRIPPSRGVLDTTLCDKVGQWLAAGRLFSPWPPRYNWNWYIVESGVKHYYPLTLLWSKNNYEIIMVKISSIWRCFCYHKENTCMDILVFG